MSFKTFFRAIQEEGAGKRFGKLCEFKLEGLDRITFDLDARAGASLKRALNRSEMKTGIKLVQEDDYARGKDRISALLQTVREPRKRSGTTNAEIEGMARKAFSRMTAAQVQQLMGDITKEIGETTMEGNTGVALKRYPEIRAVSKVQELKAVLFDMLHEVTPSEMQDLHILASRHGVLVDVMPRIADGKLQFHIEELNPPEEKR